MQPEIFSLSSCDLNELLCIGKESDPVVSQIEKLSNYFLGVPYKLLQDPIFPGQTLEQLLYDLAYKEEPEVAAAGLDCVTFVETVLALVLSMHCQALPVFKDVFRTNLISLRYHNGRPNFFSRNYFFPCIDWLPNNSCLIKDITQEICPNSAYARTIIDKLSWLYQYKLLDPYRNSITIVDLAAKLDKIGICFTSKESVVPYIESTELLKDYHTYTQHFPESSIVFIVRPDWDVTDLYNNYGTHLNISHLGFCIKRQNELYFYHASSVDERVVMVEKLDVYLTKYLNSETVKGIHVEGWTE